MTDDVGMYNNYSEWKDWNKDDFMKILPWQENYYSDELRKYNIRDGKILEMGFGNGNFLRWAHDKGATLFGTEVLPQAIYCAQEAGVVVIPLELDKSIPAMNASFRLIAAFDVLEHISYNDISAILDQVSQLLEPGGIFIARFPNSQSPFGCVYQNGDMTHVTALSGSIFRQMLINRPFDVIHIGNAAPVRTPGLLRGLAASARARLQRILEFSLSRLYAFSEPLGPNTVIVIRRKA